MTTEAKGLDRHVQVTSVRPVPDAELLGAWALEVAGTTREDLRVDGWVILDWSPNRHRFVYDPVHSEVKLDGAEASPDQVRRVITELTDSDSEKAAFEAVVKLAKARHRQPPGRVAEMEEQIRHTG